MALTLTDVLLQQTDTGSFVFPDELNEPVLPTIKVGGGGDIDVDFTSTALLNAPEVDWVDEFDWFLVDNDCKIVRQYNLEVQFLQTVIEPELLYQQVDFIAMNDSLPVGSFSLAYRAK